MRAAETVTAEQIVIGDVIQNPIEPGLWVHITEIGFMPHDASTGTVYRFAGHPQGYSGAYVEHGTAVSI